MNQTSMGRKIHPICQCLMNTGLLVVNLFDHLKKMMEICLMIKSLVKLVKIEHNKHGDTNSPNMAVFIEHDIAGHNFILTPQENGHKLWVRIVTTIDDHEKKWRKTQVISSSQIKLRTTSMRGLCHVIKWIIIL